MSERSAEFNNVVADLEDAYVMGLRAFCAWAVAEWKLDGADEWAKAYDISSPYPGDGYRDGWNACLQALDGALDVFMEDRM